MDDAGLDQGDRRKERKCTVAEHILEVELTKQADRLVVGIRMTPRVLACTAGWMGVPFTEMENGRWRSRVRLRGVK